MIKEFPKDQCKISICMGEYERYLDQLDRRLYLTVPIEDGAFDFDMTVATEIVDNIIAYNREDRDLPKEERKPIRLYINSPGGDVTDGFAIVNAIKISKTPIYTVNIGQWSSMAFLIGITGHRRFSLPNMTFLMHDGSTFTFGSSNKAQDKMKFEQRYENEVVKSHIMAYSKMTSSEYDALSRVEYYMLPEDAIKHGFIDEIVEDINTIL